jgi:hypothetical protein
VADDTPSAVGVIRIKNWKKFQNYKFRNPPWIRLYGDLLDAEETPWYRGLTDTGARVLFELWLLARRDKGLVPYDTLMILRDLHRPTSDKPLLDAALTELASVGAITVAGADASAAFLNTLAHRGTELQSDRGSETVASQPADAAQQQQPTGNGSLPRETPNPFKVLFPLIRDHLWRPDGKCPTEIAGKPWTEEQEGTVIRELAKAYSVSELETVVLGLSYMLRGLAESERPEWLEVGAKASLRAVYKSRSGVVQMVEHCRRAFWSVENKRPKKPRAPGPTAVSELLGEALP